MPSPVDDPGREDGARTPAEADATSLWSGTLLQGMVTPMLRVWLLAKVVLAVGAATLVFSLEAVTHDVTKAWRCRPDPLATSYERAEACRPESWR